MAVHNIADIRNVGNCAEILISVDNTSTATVDYDTIFESISEVLDA